MKEIEKILDSMVYVLITVALSIMVIATFAQVVFRFIVNAPLFWSEELGRYCFVYIVFIGGAWASKTMSHLGVDYFVSKLPNVAGRAIDVLIDILIMVFSTVVIWVSWPVVSINMKQLSPALQIPMGLIYMAIPIGFILMVGYYGIHCINHIKILTKRSFTAEESEG